MDYINPFAGLPQADSSIESPFLRDMARGTRENQSMPFLEMARQRQQLELMARDSELSEKFSPLATKARQTGYQKDITTNEQTIRALPWKTNQEISDAKHKIIANPAITEQRIAEAKQAAIRARGTPAAQLFNDIASINTQLKKLPEEARPLAAQHYIEQFKARHPGAKLPTIMEKYDPVHWDLAELVAINTAEHQQKIIQQETKDKTHMEREKEQTRRAESVAEIAAASRDRATDARGTGVRPPKTDQEAFQRGQEILNNPESTPEQLRAGAQMMQNWIRKRAEDFAKANPLQSMKDPTFISKKIKEYEDLYGITEAVKGAPKTNTPKVAPKSVNIGGKDFSVSRVDPDGTLWVKDPASGKERPIKPKGR